MAGNQTVNVSYTISYDLTELEDHYDRTFTDEELSEMANDDYLSAGGGEWMVEREGERPYHLVTFTSEDATKILERRVTTSECRRIVKALEFSSMGEVFGDVVTACAEEEN